MPKREPIPSPLDKLKRTVENVVAGESITEPSGRLDVQAVDNPAIQDVSRSEVQTFTHPNVQPSKRLKGRTNSAGWEPQTIYLPSDLRRRIKAHAALEGREISDIAAEVFQDYLARKGH